MAQSHPPLFSHGVPMPGTQSPLLFPATHSDSTFKSQLPAGSRSGPSSSLLSPRATQPPPTRHFSRTPARDVLYEGPDARNPALSATASPGLEKPTSCCRRGKVTAQLPRPACDPATCRAWQAPELPLPPAARAATGLAQLPPGGRVGRRPLATRGDPQSPRRPRRRAPTPVPGRPAASAPPPQPLTRAGTVLRRRDRAA